MSKLLHICLAATVAFFILPQVSLGQTPAPLTGRTEIKQFALYAEGSHPGLQDSVRFGLRINDKSTVTGGLIGSNFHVSLGTGNNLTAGIYSGNRIYLGSGNVVNGNLLARNDAGVSFKTISVGAGNNQIGIASPQSGGLIHARGNVDVALSSGNTIQGPVRIQQPYKYSGPAPASGPAQYQATLDMPTLPVLPTATNFPAYGTKNVAGGDNISPGNYQDLVMKGKGTVTFKQPGVYVFRSMKSSGKNKFNFVIPAGSTESYRIYVHEDVDLGPMEVTVNNLGADGDGNFPLASRIYTEIHGTGATVPGGNAFRIKDTARAAGISAYWAGTIYATRGSIVLGSANSTDTYSAIYGALWSKTRIFIGNNVRVAYQPLSFAVSVIDPLYTPPPTGKVYDKIGAELTFISQNSGDLPEDFDDVFRIDTETSTVLIEVIAVQPNDANLLSFLQSLGFVLVSSAPDNLVITGYFPIANLTLLNNRSDIDYVRPLFEAIRNSGQVTTLGDTTMKSDAVRSRFGIEGNGVTVGVISDSYNTQLGEAHDVQEGDLPANVVVARDFPTKRTDEGRAMAQIVFDVAPKANLVFRTGCISPLDFALGIKQLALPPYKCNVMVDDITYITEPFLKDGYVAKAVNDVVTNNGVTYLSAAGNFGSKSFETVFSPLTGTALPNGIPGVGHNFGSSGVKQKLHFKKGVYTIVLQWDDNFYSLGGNAGATVDLDIYLMKPDGSTFGFNRNSLTTDPIEVLPFTVNEETDANLLIVRDGGTANVKFKYIIFRGEATIYNYAGSSTIIGQANATNSITVGAMLYGNVNNLVPDYPSVASFSSRGGTTISGEATPRKKPELIAPNGVNTTVVLNSDPAINIDGDPYPNFFGTSAAVPHAAAVAAMLIEGKTKFNLQAVVTPTEVRNLMQSTAKDMHETGFDYKSGYGAIQADGAMLQLANARPILSALVPPTGLKPTNTTDFVLKVKGKYLNQKTKIYLRGAEITTSFVNSEELSATISGPISDDPPIQLYNPPKSVSGLDGGLSEALFFFSTRKNVTVIADNQTKKYGEALPTFTASVLIDGVPLSSTNVTLSSLKLDGSNLSFSTFATSSSTVANYSILPYRTTPLDPNNPTDAAIINQYYFTFIPGTLTVQKLSVKITPRNQTVTYGEYVGGITYDFDFGTTTVDATVQQSLRNAYKKYLADNTLVVLNGLSTPVSTTVTNMLTNMSTLASFQSVRNARKYLVQNGQLVPVTGTIAPDQIQAQRFLVDLSAQSLTAFKNDSAKIYLVSTPPENKLRGLISARAVANGTGQAALPNGQLQSVVNGQLLAMVNGHLQAIVSGQLLALVNGSWVTAADIVYHNGQLMGMVNGNWIPITSGQIQAVVNGLAVTVNLTVQNGQLQASVNGQVMSEVNGQLQAVINGQILAIVNGQLQAVINGQMMPVLNGQLQALVNGQLQSVVNGQILAVVNGQLVVPNYVVYQNGQILAMVNGQLQSVVNGQLLAMINGQLLSMVNGQLMALVNGQLTFVIFTNGQLQSVVNGQLQALVNGQLLAVINGALQNVDSYTIINGQMQAVVNGQLMSLVNGQLQSVVNGQLQALVNNFGGVSATNNNSAAIVIDRDDISVQLGAIGGMFSVNTITGLNAGVQKLVPGTFFDPNCDVRYGTADITILPAPLTVDADWKFIYEGSPAPAQSFYTSTIKGLGYSDSPGLVTGVTYSLTPTYKGAAGLYIIKPANPSLVLPNYKPLLFDTGRLYVNPYGNNAKKIIVQRECVRMLTAAETAQTGFRYAAVFSYNNRNAAAVYIPKGPDNFITIEPGGSFQNTLPEVFEPGTYFVTILFSGHKMYWQLQSMDTDHKTAITSDVDSSAQKCSTLTTRISQEVEIDMVQDIGKLVYPNPAHDLVRLQITEPLLADKGISVFDASGGSHSRLQVKRINDQTIELKVASLAPGIYLVQVETKQGYQTLRFTKL